MNQVSPLEQQHMSLLLSIHLASMNETFPASSSSSSSSTTTNNNGTTTEAAAASSSSNGTGAAINGANYQSLPNSAAVTTNTAKDGIIATKSTSGAVQFPISRDFLKLMRDSLQEAGVDMKGIHIELLPPKTPQNEQNGPDSTSGHRHSTNSTGSTGTPRSSSVQTPQDENALLLKSGISASLYHHQLALLLRKDYFGHSVLYTLVKCRQREVLLNWLQGIFLILEADAFIRGVNDSSSGASSNSPQDTIKERISKFRLDGNLRHVNSGTQCIREALQNITEECFCVLCAKSWSLDLVKLIYLKGVKLFGWNNPDKLRNLRCEGKNPMHFACEAQNMQLVRWLHMKTGLRLDDCNEGNQNGFSYWLNSHEHIPGASTPSFLQYALRNGYEEKDLYEYVGRIRLTTQKERLKQVIEKYVNDSQKRKAKAGD